MLLPSLAFGADSIIYGNFTTQTIRSGEYLDGGTTTVDSTSEGIILPRATSCSSATTEGQICWDTDDDALYIGDSSTANLVTAEAITSDSVHFSVRKGSSGTIAKGLPVYISGYNSGLDVYEVEAADADDNSKMHGICITIVATTNSATVDCMVVGTLKGTSSANLNTNSWDVGKELFIDIDGSITTTAPTGATAHIQHVGEVLRKHSTLGVIAVHGFEASSNLIVFAADAGLTADNNDDQANALALTSTFNQITTGGSNDAVKLLSAIAGLMQVVINETGATIQVFPNSSDKIDDGSANAATTVANNAVAQFFAIDNEYWYKLEN